MIDTREYISNLGMPEKVTLFKELYNELAGYGIDGDTELAHVNTFEASLLKSLGGSGTINDVTGLTEYKGGGGQQQAPPAQSTVTQTSEFPTELKPFIKDVLGEGQAEFVREKEEGFQAFPGPQLAQFTPEQQAAFTAGREQFTGLAGTPLGQASTYYQPALAATALGTAEIGTEDIQRRMDPFLQNVVDIAKREARRDEDVAAQQRAAQAVGAGSFGGSRQAIVESEAERNLGERLADIQARGLSASFQQAQQAAEQQRAREMTGGRQFAALGDTTGARARSDIAGLAGIGETQQQRSQQALDIAQREFEQERAFPQAALQRYASLIRGFPLQATQQRFATQTVPTPSFAQTLLGGAGQGAALYGMMGGFKNKGGLVSLQGGGQPMGSQVAMGNIGGPGVTPRPRPEQSPPILDATRDQQITALNAMQQRGAALRQLSKPQSNISPMNIRDAIVGSGVLPGSRRMAKEGGLMSVVKKQIGGYLGEEGAEERLAAEDMQRRMAEDLIKFGEGVQFGQQNYPYPKRDLTHARAFQQKLAGQEQRLAEREKDLHERRIREQYGNIAQFFGRLGTSTAPAAQVGGVRGLLGAAVAAGSETIPEALATEEEFYGREMDLADQVAAAELAGLEAAAGIEETEYGAEKDIAQYELARREVEGRIAQWTAKDPAKIGVTNALMEHAQNTLFGGKLITNEEGELVGGNGVPVTQEALKQYWDIIGIGVDAVTESGLEGNAAAGAGIKAMGPLMASWGFATAPAP
jgi:hypothetical protein